MRAFDQVVFGVEFVVEECINKDCGITFAMTRELYNRLQKSKESESFYCPRGHRMWYTGKTEEQKLRDKLRNAEAAQTAMADQLRAATAEGEQLRVALVRDRYRFSNGVCPCCNRTFSNVARHMTTQHPDYDVAKVTAPAGTRKYQCSCGRGFDTPHGLAVHQGRQRPPGWDTPTTSKWAAHLTKV